MGFIRRKYYSWVLLDMKTVIFTRVAEYQAVYHILFHS
jgi:hypothetical protein